MFGTNKTLNSLELFEGVASGRSLGDCMNKYPAVDLFTGSPEGISHEELCRNIHCLLDLGAAGVYGSLNAGIWMNYIRDPVSSSTGSIGIVPSPPAPDAWASIYVMKESSAHPAASLGIIGDRYAGTFKQHCNTVSYRMAVCLLNHIEHHEQTANAVISEYRSEKTGSELQYLDKFLELVKAERRSKKRLKKLIHGGGF